MTRYMHTNIVAEDWRRIAAFYEEVFDCERVRTVAETRPWLAEGTGVPGAAVEGVHLRLPGGSADGPTIEVYSLSPLPDDERPFGVIRRGFGHLAFLVDDVPDVLDRVLAAGGSRLGTVVEVEGAGALHQFVYARDPEGNVIEIQSMR